MVKCKSGLPYYQYQIGELGSVYVKEKLDHCGPQWENELVLVRPIMGWLVCIDYLKLNTWTHKDHFPMPFMYQMLDHIVSRRWYYLLDGYSVDNQISIAPEGQDKTFFNYLYSTFYIQEDALQSL